jgi:hypothetical protein
MLSIGGKECIFFSSAPGIQNVAGASGFPSRTRPSGGSWLGKTTERGVVCYREHRNTSCRFLLCCCLMLVYRV